MKPRSTAWRAVGSMPISMAMPQMTTVLRPQSRNAMASGVPSKAEKLILSKIASLGRGASSSTMAKPGELRRNSPMQNFPAVCLAVWHCGRVRSLVRLLDGTLPMWAGCGSFRSVVVFIHSKGANDPGRTIYLYDRAVFPERCRPHDSRDAREAIFSCDQRTVLEQAADLENHGRGVDKKWCPTRIGGSGDEYLPFLKGLLIWGAQNFHLSSRYAGRNRKTDRFSLFGFERRGSHDAAPRIDHRRQLRNSRKAVWRRPVLLGQRSEVQGRIRDRTIEFPEREIEDLLNRVKTSCSNKHIRLL